MRGKRTKLIGRSKRRKKCYKFLAEEKENALLKDVNR